MATDKNRNSGEEIQKGKNNDKEVKQTTPATQGEDTEMKDVNEPVQESDSSDSDIDLAGPTKKDESKEVSRRVKQEHRVEQSAWAYPRSLIRDSEDDDSESDIDLVGPTKNKSYKKAKKNDGADDTAIVRKKATKGDTTHNKADKNPKKPKRAITGRDLSRVEILKLALKPAAERIAECSNVYGCHGLILYSLRKGGRRQKENPFLDPTQDELDEAKITRDKFPRYATKGRDTKKGRSGGEERAVLEQDAKGAASNVTVVWDYARSSSAAISSLILNKEITDFHQDTPDVIRKSVMELNLQGLTLGSLAYQVQRHMLTNGGWSSTDIGRFVLQKMELAYSIEASTLYKNLHSSSDAAIYDGALDSETIRILSGERDVSGRKVEDFELRCWAGRWHQAFGVRPADANVDFFKDAKASSKCDLISNSVPSNNASKLSLEADFLLRQSGLTQEARIPADVRISSFDCLKYSRSDVYMVDTGWHNLEVFSAKFVNGDGQRRSRILLCAGSREADVYEVQQAASVTSSSESAALHEARTDSLKLIPDDGNDILYRTSKTIKPGFTPATFQETESEDQQTGDIQAAADTSAQEQQIMPTDIKAGDAEVAAQKPKKELHPREGRALLQSSYMLTTYASAAETREKTTKATKTPKPAAEKIPGLQISQSRH
ncbi:hypothetical protein MBM_02692 [Drepanopeziza brunnea f. sp. 'multigermtubi' MB_m1]|uniref:Uncharacterized protein n=1 Tax=Marssonina brunnea f. sp. multigermtubi (strain MB_m1) TaxID=1072389 RepID=K1WP55_MARBU|nr:uncharacterized protein MBM_02692 [Drepanopeziza brunnea f. sp. 'multigermtubi' MB_m1]EKD19455.1 hypothetical protein MBM_02692 [Drepanopeziza brunnea f. sp. 'multigermtubi' MB_m1]